MLTKIKSFLKKYDSKNLADELYWQIVEKSRSSFLYKELSFEDNTDGRFDSLIMHIFPLLNWLKENNYKNISNEIIDILIKDIDRSFRQSGVGDPSIARKMRKVGEAYMGRISVYDDAVKSLPDKEKLKKSLFRNIYRSNKTKKDNLDQLVEYFLSILNSYDGYVLGNYLPNNKYNVLT